MHKKLGFTLVELIVVITILSVLATVAFISFQGYTKSARDSVRIADIKIMSKALELSKIKDGSLPLPTNGVQILHSGGLAWTQGTFGESILSKIQSMSDVPVDPVTGLEYAYSVTNSNQEYQIGGLLEGLLASKNNGIVSSTHALEGYSAIIKGNYTSKGILVRNGSDCNTVATPSIILSDIGSSNTYSLTGNVNFVLHNNKNLPSNLNSKFTDSELKQGANFNVSIIYDKCSIQSNTEVDEIVNNLNIAYKQYEGLSEGTLFTGIIETPNDKNVKIETVLNGKKYGLLVLESVINEIESTPSTSSSNVVFADNFTDSDGIRLDTHIVDVGNGWTNDPFGGASYHLFQETKGEWSEKYIQHFPINYDTKSFLFTPNNNSLRLRVKQENTEFASIDQVSLSACDINIDPVYAQYIDSKEDVFDRILHKDFRVVDSHDKFIELFWEIPKNCHSDVIVSLHANEYSSVGVKPLQYPMTEDYSTVSRVLTNRNIQINGNIDEIDGIQEPSDQVFWQPSTGHPDNYTYFYFNEDENNLYLSVDVTLDNTDDLDKDWAELTIHSENEKYVFKIDDTHQTWGKCGFGMTSKVSYEHQYCEFKIPKTEFDSDINSLNYSFRYYGTAGTSFPAGYVIENNQLKTDAPWPPKIYPIGNLGTNDYKVEFDIIDNVGSTIDFYIRDNGSDAYNFFYYNGDYTLSTMANGNIVTGSKTINNNSHISFSVVGDNLKLDIDNVNLFDVNDSTISTGITTGLVLQNGTIIDNYKITKL